MHSVDNFKGNIIKVVPFYTTAPIPPEPVEISKLYFWYKNSFDHPVTWDTLQLFLFYADLFGAYFYPKCPELGCFAINADMAYVQGEAKVNQILYRDELIYCFSKI